jgi:hypothetical protein
MRLLKGLLLCFSVLATTTAAAAQTTVSLPDTSLTTKLVLLATAVVTVPAGVTFNVTNINASSAASPASVSVTAIVIVVSGQVNISLKAGAASFTPPAAGATTWSAGDVSWNAASWTNATGAAGTLSSSAFGLVATCPVGVTSCSTTGLVFTLKPKPTVKISGHHTLTIIWKFEAI